MGGGRSLSWPRRRPLLAAAQVDERRFGDGPVAADDHGARTPANKGAFTVKTLSYGSGTDKQRPEFGKDVTIKTKTVDASPFATITEARRRRTA